MPLDEFMPTLRRLAEEHLDSMATVPWADFAKAIRKQQFPDLPAGGTFGCTVEDKYYDMGDYVVRAGGPNGDIRLVSHATTYSSAEDCDGLRYECERLVRRV